MREEKQNSNRQTASKSPLSVCS